MKAVASHVPKIYSNSSLLNEIRAIWYIISRLPLARGYQEPSKSGNDPVIAIGTGFLATGHPYYLLARMITEQGYRVVIIDPHSPNAHKYLRGTRRLIHNINDILDKYGRLDCWVGHSLSGIVGVMMLPRYEKHLKHIITLGSPFGGTPSRILQILTSYIIIPQAQQKRILTNIIKKALPYRDRIITITTDKDDICPPERGTFPGARLNYVYRADEDPDYGGDQFDEILNTHTGLPYFRPVQQLLFQEFKTL